MTSLSSFQFSLAVGRRSWSCSR